MGRTVIPSGKMNFRRAQLWLKNTATIKNVPIPAKCLSNGDLNALATVVNGNLIRIYTGSPKLTYGSKTIFTVDADTGPVMIDNTRYVPRKNTRAESKAGVKQRCI